MQPRQYHALTARASLVGNLEHETAVAKSRTLNQAGESAGDRYGAGIREDFEGASHRRREAEN